MSLNIAIIGSGIAGLTAARRLSEHHSVTIYEKKAQLGLGSEGIEVTIQGEEHRVDVPPRVINEVHYPNLFRLLRENNIATYPIYQQPNFCSSSGDREFSLWSGKLSLPFLNDRYFTLPKLDWKNFKWLSQNGFELMKWMRLLKTKRYQSLKGSEMLRPWLEAQGFSTGFIEHYLYGIWALMCSANKSELDQYPARAMAQLFHHFSGSACAQRITGGTKALEAALIKHVDSICLDSEVLSIAADPQGTRVETRSANHVYDHVIVATEPAIANRLLSDDFKTEKTLLSRIPYRNTEMVMHCDERLMPNDQRDWSAVNIMRDSQNEPWATVWMNAIENKALPSNIFQSWDPLKEIDEEKVLARRTFHRSLLTSDSANAMDSLLKLQLNDNQRKLWLAGSYLTHQIPLLEDGVRSATQVCERIALIQKETPQIKRPAA